MGPPKEVWSRASECAKTVVSQFLASPEKKNNDPFANINNKNKKVVLFTI